jgi:hypothetical protein
LVVAVPTGLVKTASTSIPFTYRLTFVALNVVVVASVSVVHELPWLIENCQIKVGVGTPDAAAVKFTEPPGATV